MYVLLETVLNITTVKNRNSLPSPNSIYCALWSGGAQLPKNFQEGLELQSPLYSAPVPSNVVKSVGR